MASTYKNNPLVLLETPNEPNPTGLSQTPDRPRPRRSAPPALPIRSACNRAAVSTSPISLPWSAAVGTNQLFVTPHIYIGGTPTPTVRRSYVQSEISAARVQRVVASIDEFGNAMDGFTMDPYGQHRHLRQ